MYGLIGKHPAAPVILPSEEGQQATAGVSQPPRHHRLSLNNELEDVDEDTAAQVREFLASLRHGG
jgi:hypothetical protein